MKRRGDQGVKFLSTFSVSPPGSVIESFVQAALPKGGEECAIGANIGGKRCQSPFSLHREPYKGGRAAASSPFSKFPLTEEFLPPPVTCAVMNGFPLNLPFFFSRSGSPSSVSNQACAPAGRGMPKKSSGGQVVLLHRKGDKKMDIDLTGRTGEQESALVQCGKFTTIYIGFLSGLICFSQTSG